VIPPKVQVLLLPIGKVN